MPKRGMGRSWFFVGCLVCSPTLAVADPATESVAPTENDSSTETAVSRENDPSSKNEAGGAATFGATRPEMEEADQGSEAAGSSRTGFYLRTSVGGGFFWAHAEETSDQPDLAMQALGPSVMLSPGYQIAPGIAVHADLYSSLALAVRLSPDDGSLGYERKKTGFIASTVGAGLTYHALPDDLYASAGFGISGAWGSQWTRTFEVLTEPAMTGVGYAAHGSVGKLFAAHPRWSLGGSLNYNLQTFGRRDDDILTIKRVHALWLGFSSTFHPRR